MKNLYQCATSTKNPSKYGQKDMSEKSSKKQRNQAFRMDSDGNRVCLRCHEPFGNADKCIECGVHKDRRVIQHYRRQRPIGGKRGRNSGRVRTTK